MNQKEKITVPKYQQIAADLAAKISHGQYKPGDKVYARSSLASQYHVSAETARRAICVLADLEIVQSTKGSGVVIQSLTNAEKFVRQYHDVKTINDLKQDITASVARQRQEMDKFNGYLSELIEKTEKFHSVNPFLPFQIEIIAPMPYLNHSTADVNFWQNTAGTIIAIKREDKIIMSPGPYAQFKEHDIFYFIGEKDCLERVTKFLYPKE